ncbi:hypothetical protein CsSME_00032789 [Camellia sinensis var. sinensis]
MGHQNAFMVIPLWVIGNVSVHMRHQNALCLSLYGSSECFHVVPSWVIGFVNANGCTMYYHVKFMNFEYEYDYVYESVSTLLFDYTQDSISVSRRVTRSKLLRGEHCLVDHPFCAFLGGLLAGYGAKPMGVGLGRDRVVSEHELYTMENARSDDATGSSEARMSRMEQMLATLTESLRQQAMPPLPPPAETWLLEMEKLYEVFPYSKTQKVGVLKLPTYVKVLDRALMTEATLATMKQSKAPTTTELRGKSGSIPVCSDCERKHKGFYYRATGAYFRYGKIGHMMRDCPVWFENINCLTVSSARSTSVTRTNARTNARGDTRNETLRQGRVFTLVPGDVHNTKSVVSDVPERPGKIPFRSFGLTTVRTRMSLF